MLERRKRVGLIRATLFLLSVATTVACSTRTEAGMIQFSDGIFNDADWSATFLGSVPAGFSGTTGEQVLIGGSPTAPSGFPSLDTAFRQTSYSINPTDFEPHRVLNLNTTAVYDPSTQGAINSFSYGYNFIEFTTNNGQNSGVAFAMEQNGTIYRDVSFGYPQDSSDWTGVSTSFGTGTNLTRAFGSGPEQPDFSASGAPITFGYWESVIFNDSDTLETRGVDNWHVTLNTEDVATSAVPEPSSFVLLGMGVVGLFAFGFQRRRSLAALPTEG